MKFTTTQFKPAYFKRIFILMSAFLFLIWLIWDNLTIQISHIEISDEQIPEEFTGFKIAHLSDLHNKNWGPTLIEPIQAEKPDMIVITGDLIDARKPDIYVASELINQIKEIAPIYFVTGNHEAVSEYYPLLEESLLIHDVTILNNDAITLQKNEAEIVIMGVQDPVFISEGSFLNEQAAIVESEIMGLKNDFNDYSILLSHRPELFDLYVRNEINLALTGHAHGGQIRLPFIGGLVAPNQGLFPKYTSGVYQEGQTHMVVSRGLGNSIIPVRINNRAELIFIELNSDTGN